MVQLSLITSLSISENILVASSRYKEFDDESTSPVDGHLDWRCETTLDGPLISLDCSSNKVVPDIQLVARVLSVTRDFWVSFETDR